MTKSKRQWSSDKRLKKAKQYLAGGRGVSRDDSDDELGFEDHPWEYIFSEDGSEKIGANMGEFKCMLGDTVLLKAEGTKEAWVAILCQFGDLESDIDKTGVKKEKSAYFMWFSTEKEIHNRKKKLTDCLSQELYITPSWDWNPLTTINGKATVLSYNAFEKQYPTFKVPRNSREFGKVFFCRRGCNTRTATYTGTFEWNKIYNGYNDLHSLVQLVRTGTWSTRKRRHNKAGNDHYIEEPDDSEIEESLQKTPSKRRKTSFSDILSKSGPIGTSQWTTPKHRKVFVKKPLEYSPLGTRTISTQHNSSPFQRARSQLHVSSVPSSLPGREDAFEAVYKHLEAAITEGSGSCIYISGTPGTGKTATVREVISQLDAAVSNEELDDFIFVEINGMKVTEPQQAYVQLWQALRGEIVSAHHALDLLEREFTYPNPRRVPCVVLMDELDQLVTKNQSVMYNFFNWPNLRHSRLIVLAVANTMDLPERTLSNKISSRLGLVRIPFAGYSHTDLMKIVQSRFEGVSDDIVDPDAIQFASRKVAAVSGDARRALDICRRAVEIAETENLELNPVSSFAVPENAGLRAGKLRQSRVTIATIKRAINEATSSPARQALENLSLSAKLILAAISAHFSRTGQVEAGLAEVLEQARRLSNSSEQAWVRGLLLPYGVVSNIVGSVNSKFNSLLPRPSGLGLATEELIQMGFVTVEARRGDRVGRIRLNVTEDEIRMGLKEDKIIGKLGFTA